MSYSINTTFLSFLETEWEFQEINGSHDKIIKTFTEVNLNMDKAYRA